jgi:hypothetical protein
MSEKLPKRVSSDAEKLFIRASKKYSASVSSQAAYIALECKRLHEDPKKLCAELLKSKDALEYIRGVAKHAHQHMPDYEMPEVEISNVRGIIQHDFDLAIEFMKIDEKVLETIIDPLYQKHILDYKQASIDERMDHEDILEREIKTHLKSSRKGLARFIQRRK